MVRGSSAWGILSALRATPLPRLQSLALHRVPPTYRSELPVDLFKNLAPHLQTLRLHGFGVPWASPLTQMPKLTHLVLQANRPSVPQLLAVLQAMPALAHLELLSSLPTAPPPKAMEPSCLACLQELVIVDKQRCIINSLPYIAYSSETRLTMTITKTAFAAAPVIPLLTRFYKDPLRSFSVGLSNTPTVIELAFWFSDEELGDLTVDQWSQPSRFRSVVHVQLHDIIEAEQTLRNFYDLPEIPDVTSLHCSSIFFLNRGNSWNRTFSTMPGVRFLSLDVAVLPCFLCYISSLERLNRNPKTPSLFFPSLETISVYGERFDNTSLFLKFRDFLLESERKGRKLRKAYLDVREASVSHEVAQHMRELCGLLGDCQCFGRDEAGAIWFDGSQHLQVK